MLWKDISSSKGFIFFKTNEKITKVMKNFQKMKIQLHPFVSFYELCDFTILTLSFQKSIRKLVFSFDTRIKKLKKKLRLNFKDIFIWKVSDQCSIWHKMAKKGEVTFGRLYIRHHVSCSLELNTYVLIVKSKFCTVL